MSEIIKIPAERVKAIRGDGDSTKRLIEEKCKVRLEVDSEGDVEIHGESTEIFFAKDVIKAIGRGFEPRHALKLVEHDYQLYIIPLKEVTKSDKAITRLKGRVIGEKGKIKSEIESATDSFLSIYGNTIGIISKMDSLEYAREAVAMLLEGAPHNTVINYLAKARRELMESRLKG